MPIVIFASESFLLYCSVIALTMSLTSVIVDAKQHNAKGSLSILYITFLWLAINSLASIGVMVLLTNFSLEWTHGVIVGIGLHLLRGLSRPLIDSLEKRRLAKWKKSSGWEPATTGGRE